MQEFLAALVPEDGCLPLTIGITGHRDIHEGDRERASAAIAELLGSLADTFPSTPLRLLSPLAEGADRIAAEVFLAVREQRRRRNEGLAGRWELVVPMPLPEPLFREDFLQSTDQFERLRREADLIFHLPIREEADERTISVHGQERDLQYQDASRFVASHSDILIAVWDGLELDRKGGTADTVRMRLSGHTPDRRQQASPLVNPDPGIVYYINVRRVAADEPGSRPSALLDEAQLASDHDVLLRLGRRFLPVESHNSSLRRRLSDEDVRRSARYLLPDADGGAAAAISAHYCLRKCMAIYASADALSIHFERLWARYLLILYGLGAVTALALPMAIEGIELPWTMFAYLATMAVAAALFSYLRAAAVEDLHLDSRALAELMRVQFYWLFADLEDEGNPSHRNTDENRYRFHQPVTRVLLGQQESDLGWIADQARRIIAVDDVRMPLASEGIKQSIVTSWIEGQNRYFEKSLERMERRVRSLSRTTQIFMIGGLLSAACAILMTLTGFTAPLWRHGLVILAAWMPVTAVVFESYADKLSLEAQVKTNRRMSVLYRTASMRWKNAAPGSAERSRLVIELGREAVTEAASWLFFKRNKPMKLPT